MPQAQYCNRDKRDLNIYGACLSVNMLATYDSDIIKNSIDHPKITRIRHQDPIIARPIVDKGVPLDISNEFPTTMMTMILVIIICQFFDAKIPFLVQTVALRIFFRWIIIDHRIF